MATKFHCDRCDVAANPAAQLVIDTKGDVSRATICEACVTSYILWFNQMNKLAFDDLPPQPKQRVEMQR